MGFKLKNINKYKYNKIIKSILISSFMGTFIITNIMLFVPISKVNASDGDMNQILQALLGGNRISDNVTYSYNTPSDIDGLYVMCRAYGGDTSKNPVLNTKASYQCYVQASNAIISQPIQIKSITPTEAGSQTLDFNFPAIVQQKTVNKKTKKINNNNENIIVTLSLNVTDPSTSITSETGSDSENAVVTEVNTGNTGNTNNGDTTAKTTDTFKAACSDGTNWCPEETTTTTTKTKGEQGAQGQQGAQGKQGSDGTNGTNGQSGSDGTNGQSGSDGTHDTGNSGSSYKNLLDDLLGDNNGSYNSNDGDWAKSNNGEGTSDLNDYFLNGDGTSDDTNAPNGTTTDLLGVSDNLNNNGNNTESAQQPESGYYDNNGDDNNQSADNDNNNNDYDNGDTSNDNNSSLPMQDLSNKYQDGLAGLDGLTADNNSLLGAITTDGTNGSLSQKMKELIGDNSVSNNKKGNGTDQELFDTAKKILLSAGFSLNDIQNGKNYDANSAYTEPATSWDMNRITTLLNGKKIKLTNPSEVKNSSSNSK